MKERELGGAYGASPDEFVTDLATLSNNDLRKKYRQEESSHRNRKHYSRRHGWHWDPAWEDFRAFLRDMGPVPEDGCTLDRLDHELERYGPGLCRWATKAEQTRNRRNTRYVEYRGEKLSIAEFATLIGKPYKTVHSALARDVPPDRIAAPPSVPYDHLYCPLRYVGNESALAGWYSRYEAWLKKEVPKGKRAVMRPELWDLIQCSAAYKRGRDWLTARGYFETSPDDALDHLNALEQATEGQHYLLGLSWIEHALATLRRTNPAVAQYLRSGGRWNPFNYYEFAETIVHKAEPDGFRHARAHSAGYERD